MQTCEVGPPRPFGVGLAYRACLHREICQHARHIDLLEIPTEDYIVRRRRLMSDPTGELLRDALARFACIAHGIGMSIGSVEPLEREYMDGTRRWLDETGMTQFSEHLAFHRIDGVDVEMFQCLPFTDESLAWLTAQYWQARQWLGRPIGLENVSYSPPVRHCPLGEAEFLAELTRRTDCFLLLDVTNVFNNASNHGYDPEEFIRQLPGDRIRQMHLAGGYFADGMWHDSHDAAVQSRVWELFELALQATAAEVVILERDGNFLPFSAVMRDVERAREIFYRHRSTAPVAAPQQPPSPPSVDDGAECRAAMLRSYQQATIRRISDDAFRRRAAARPDGAAQEHGLSHEWSQRWRDVDEAPLQLQVAKWKRNQQRALREEEAYRRFEWAQWHAQGSAAEST